MKLKYLFLSLLCLAAGLASTSCKDDVDTAMMPEAGGITLPQAVPLDEDALFGVWEAETSYGDNNLNYNEEQYRFDFSAVDDAEAIYSHWYTDAETGIRDSVCNVAYSYEFDGSTVVLTPSKSAAAAGAAVITALHVGDNRMLLTVNNAEHIDSICTLTRTGDPEPSIVSVNRTLPDVGDEIIVSGRNLQFVTGVFLPTKKGEVEIKDFEYASKKISFILPQADYVPGSIRFESESAKVNCFSPAYMFCENCVFMRNFKDNGKKPYTGTEFEYTIKDMGTLRDNAVNIASDNLPEGHSLSLFTDVASPDSMLSFFGKTPIEWPVATGTDDKKGYLRFSSGDRLQYVFDNCSEFFNRQTRSRDLAIQMDIFVVSDGKPEWSTGYLSWRFNKDVNSIGSSTTANVAGWEKDSPMSFEDGWQTFTIPLTEFSVTESGSYSTLFGLISQLKASNFQTILTIINYPLDALHPAAELSSFQFNIANIRLVPYATPANQPIK